MGKKPSICHLLFLLLIFNIHTTYAQGSLPRSEPDSKALEYYRLGRNRQDQVIYSWQQLAEISLWASGGETSPSGLAKVHELINTLNNSAELPADKKERAEFILTFLHRNTLRSYSLYQTRIDTIFSNGRFNCVSSAVLYTILCEAFGINTSGVITKDHALVTLHIDGEDIDVETTNRYGFDPGNRREFHDQFGRLTGLTYVPARNYRDRQTISKIELVSLILNNRISELERQNRFADAVPLALDRAALLLGESLGVDSANHAQNALLEDPYKNLLDRISNYGSTQLRANRITEARNFLESQKKNLTETHYAQLDSLILDAELLRSANQIRTAEDGDTVTAAVEQARVDNKIEEKRANEIITFAIQKTAASLSAASLSAASLSAAPSRDWRAAIQYIENAISRFGANRELEQALTTYRSNLATDYHNRFAAEWNKRNYDEAERILNEALAEFPDNRQLLGNRQTVERHRSR